VYLVSERTRNAFRIPCVPCDEAYTHRFWGWDMQRRVPSVEKLASQVPACGSAARIPYTLLSTRAPQDSAAEAATREMFVQPDCTNLRLRLLVLPKTL